MSQTTWKRSGVDGIMIHQVKKLIKFSVSKRLIIVKLHVLLTCFCDLKNSISACVSLSFLGDKFELDGGFEL